MWYLRDSGGTQNTAMEAKGTIIGHELDTAICGVEHFGKSLHEECRHRG